MQREKPRTNVIEENMRRREGRVTAVRQLRRRRKPAQPKVLAGLEVARQRIREGRCREVELRGDALVLEIGEALKRYLVRGEATLEIKQTAAWFPVKRLVVKASMTKTG